MKSFIGVFHFPESWNDVAVGFLSRYPNPFATHVLSEDVIDRKVDVKRGVIDTLKLLTKTNKLPKWGEHFFSGKRKQVYLIERSIIDIKKKSIQSHTRNITMGNIMKVDEWVEYRSKATKEYVEVKTEQEQQQNKSNYSFISKHFHSNPSQSQPPTICEINGTFCVKYGEFDSSLRFGMATALRQFAYQRYKKNAVKSTEGLRYVLKEMKNSKQKSKKHKVFYVPTMSKC
ncbi:hypothetical protein SNEBB_009778 [Seison nebaliae]|nr:hypothetical protein SNEBB_009778 [Seison nebaliae]